MVNVEIVTIGNEILLGMVQDTNSNYLCRVVRGMGGRVKHIAIVRDEVRSISDEISASLHRGADLVFTCGGLGPTDDDQTLAGVAEAAGVKLDVNRQAQDFVARKYRDLASRGYVDSGDMNEARLKMARLPAGSLVIENPVGSAPATVLEVGRSRIVSLPGVPAELKAIVEGPLQPVLGEIFRRGSYRESEVLIDCGDESALAPALRRVTSNHPEVYVKSRASHFGPDVRFRVLLSASAESSQEAEALIARAADDLKTALRETGIENRDEE